MYNIPIEHHIENKKYSVLALQSLNVNPVNLPNLKEYYYPPLYSQNSNSNKVMTALYIRSDLEYSEYQISVKSDSNITNLKSIEGLYYTGATIRFKGPRIDNTDWIKNISIQNKNHIILGDFNARSPMWDTNCTITTSSRFVENIINSKFLLLNTGEVTRVPDIINHKASALDLSLVSPNLGTSCLWKVLDDTLGSDHIPICIEVNRDFVNFEQIDEDIIPKFKYKLANWDLFKSKMSLINEKDIENEDPNIFFENFKNAIIAGAKSSIPQKKINKTKKKSKEWWNPTVEEIVNDKKYAFKEYIKDQKSADKFSKMKSLNKEAKKAVNDARLEDFIEFCEQEVKESRDMHKVYDKVNTFKNNSSRLQSFPIIIEDNRFPCASEKAEAFANHFARNSCKENLPDDVKKYRLEQEKTDSFKEPLPDNDHFLNSDLKYEELVDALKSMASNSSAVGLDGISYLLLNKLPANCKVLLHKLYQMIWNNGTIPISWKQSVIVPVHKQGKCRTKIEVTDL